MVKKMKAAINHGPGDLRLEEVNIPIASEGEVLAKVLAVGICGSDVKCYQGTNPVPTPVIPGHEFCAQVVELGKSSKEKNRLDVGDRVASEQIIPCNQCYYCKRGLYWLCQNNHVYGFSKIYAEGAMAEYIKLPSNSINHKLPQDMSIHAGALIEPLACAIHGVERAKILFGDIVVISGAGTIGLLMVQLAKMKNPKKIIVLDIKDDRLKLAKKFGADVIINLQNKELEPDEIIKDISNGIGCDVYIEASGNPDSIGLGLNMLRKQGRFLVFGVYSHPSSINWRVISDQKELDVFGSSLSPFCYPIAIDFLHKGLVSIEGIVTHVFKLEEINRAFQVAMTSQAIKVLIEP